MNIQNTELSPLQVGKLRKAGYHTIEELPNTVEALVQIDGVGDVTAEQILAIKARVQGVKTPPAPKAQVEPEATEPEAPEPEIEEDPKVYPTASLTRYHVACLCALDRQMGRELPGFAYGYLTALIAGQSRREATVAAGRKGSIATDKEVWEALRDFALHYTIVRSRDFGPPAGSV